MPANDDNNVKHSIRFLTKYKITDADRQIVESMDAVVCPRRYCWWWKSLSFEWNISEKDGCVFLQLEKPPGWRYSNVPCCRSVPGSGADHYESRNAVLKEDGIEDRWRIGGDGGGEEKKL